MDFGPASLRFSLMGLGAFFTDFSGVEGLSDLLYRLPTFVTYALLHGGWVHLIFNCILFVHLGREVAYAMGSKSFCLFFVLCAAGGAIFHSVLTSGHSLLVGASAVVFGVAAARGLLMSYHLITATERRRYLLQYTAGWMLLNFVIVLFTWLTSGATSFLESEVAWQAHLGGYLVGLAMAEWLFLKN